MIVYRWLEGGNKSMQNLWFILMLPTLIAIYQSSYQPFTIGADMSSLHNHLAACVGTTDLGNIFTVSGNDARAFINFDCNIIRPSTL